VSAKADSRLRRLHKLHEYLIRVRWTSNGIDIRSHKSGGKRDVKTLAEAYTMYCCLLVDLGYDINSSIEVIKQLSSYDVTKVFQTLKTLDDTLLAYLGNKDASMLNADQLFLRFKHEADGLDCIIPVIEFLCNDIRSELRLVSIRYLHQFYAFLSRVSLYTVSGEKDVEDFLHRNQSLRKVNVEIARQLDPIISDLLRGVEFEPWGHHGTGSTADAGRCHPIEKTLFIAPDRLHDYVFRHWLHANVRDYIPFPERVLSGTGERTAYVTTVPKTALKRRIIAVESVTQQWFQQLVMRALYRHIAKHIPNIPIRDQSVQCERAYVGSIGGKYATIDLSAASDSISWDLVKIAYRHSGVLPYLYMTRSRLIRVNEVSYPLNIYATMGSACCFPVMCILLYAVCVLVSNNAGQKRCDCTVYGDDIICPTKLVRDIHSVLEELGFTMNENKSYFDDTPFNFRESCGAEYFGGTDVTPVRLSRRFSAEAISDSPGSLTERVDLANALLAHGYYFTRQWVISGLLDQCVPPPIFGDLDGQIHTDDVATNYLALRRYNSDWQRLECLVTTTKPSDLLLKHIGATEPWISSRDHISDRSFDYLYEHDERVKSLIDHLSYFNWWSSRNDEEFDSLFKEILRITSSPATKFDIRLTTEWRTWH